MFRLAKQREVLWPVTVQVPADGGPQPVEIQIRYRLLRRSELADMHARIVASAEANTLLADLDAVLGERITGWEGIGDEDGTPLPFNPQTLAAVLDEPYLRQPIEDGLYAASRGALAKN